MFLSYNTLWFQFHLPLLFSAHQTQLSSPLDIIFLSSFFGKEQASKRQQPNRIKDDTIRQSKHPHTETVQGKPIGGQGQEKVKDAPIPTVRGLQNHQANSHTYTLRTWIYCRSLQAQCLPFSLYSPDAFCLVDSVGSVSPLSFTPLTCSVFPLTILQGSLSSEVNVSHFYQPL